MDYQNLPSDKMIFMNYIITAKLLTRSFALIIISFLGTATTAFTYKAAVDLVNFFSLWRFIPDSENLCIIIGVIVGIATIIQSAPIIWDRLSYWGQCMDNFLGRIFFKRKYFLDETEQLLSATRKIINKVNADFHRINWEVMTKVEKNKNSAPILEKLDNLVKNDISCANMKYQLIIDLLKNNDSADKINSDRKEKYNIELNSVIIQLTDICNKIKILKDSLL